MRNRTLCLDAHGTAFDANAAKRTILTEETGCIIPDAEFAAGGIYRLGKKYPNPDKKTLEQINLGTYRRSMGKLFEFDNYVRLMRPYAGVREELVALAQVFDHICIVANARGATVDAIQAVVDKYELPINEVIATYGDDHEKRGYFQMADVVIDNETRYLSAMNGSGVVPILMRTPEGTTGWAYDRLQKTPRGPYMVANDFGHAGLLARNAITGPVDLVA